MSRSSLSRCEAPLRPLIRMVHGCSSIRRLLFIAMLAAYITMIIPGYYSDALRALHRPSSSWAAIGRKRL